MTSKADEYRELLDGFLVQSVPMDNGDYEAFCPAHENPATSKKPSARINFHPDNPRKFPNGIIWCAVCGFKGEDAKLDNAVEIYKRRVSSGVQFEAFDRGEYRKVFGRTGKTEPLPTLAMMWDFHRALLENKERLQKLRRKRGLTAKTLRRFQVGWINRKKAFCYPIRQDGTGPMIAVRLYRLDDDAEVKHSWFNSEGEKHPQLFGVRSMENEPVIILTEGEFDCMLAQQDGFKAISHNGGAGKFNDAWVSFFRDKVVYIAYDNDSSGHKGRAMVMNKIKGVTRAVYYIDFPNPEGENGTDYTDWRLRDGHTAQEFEQMMLLARKQGPVSSNVLSGLPINGKLVSIAESTASQYVGIPLEMTVQVVGKFDGYIVPHRVTAECTQDKGDKFCSTCPMQSGVGKLEITKDSDLIPRIVDSRVGEVDKLLLKEIGANCRDRVTEIRREDEWSVEKIIVGESVETRPKNGSESLSDSNQTMNIYNIDQNDSKTNEIYRVVGHNVANPKDHHTMFLSWVREETKTNIDSFVMTDDLKKKLKIFQPGRNESPYRKMYNIAHDLGRNVAGVVKREDLIVAYDLVWHSVLGFYINNKLDDRGWVELLVFGDTRTGKSAAAQAIARHYRHGRVFSSEGATRAGLVGGATQVGSSKAWVATWGVLPLNDRRLVVLDEAQSLQNLVKDISSIRSKGVAEIVKVGIQQSAMARTRMVWICNPVGQEKLNELSNGAITALQEFMPTSEDRARFDLGVALSYEDVGAAEIHAGIMENQHTTKYPSELCESLILWAWSRKPEQIVFEDGVIQHIMDQSIAITEKYRGDFELVQESNMHVKLSRIAVAVAARLFSTDDTGENIVVTEDHVDAARDIIFKCYDNPSFGLHRAARKSKSDSKLAESKLDDIREWFLTGMIKGSDAPHYGVDVYNGIRRVQGRFHQRDFSAITGLDIGTANICFAYMRDNALLQYDAKVGDVKFSRELQDLLQEMEFEDGD